MKIMHLYLKQSASGQQFIYALKRLNEVECDIRWEYKKILEIRIIKEILVVEACDLKMLGNIVKGVKHLVSEVIFFETYEGQMHLQDILDGKDDGNA
jgi:hypothetical protein